MFFRRAVILLVPACVHAQDWTEQAVLALFEQQSPIRRETRAAAAAAVEAVRGRTLWPNPAANYSRETVGFTEFVTGEQLLPVSGRLKLAKQALAPAEESAQAAGEARLWDTRSQLRVAFYRALAAQRQEDLLQTALTDLQDVLGLLRKREEEGEGSRYDRMRVEREAAGWRADIAVARTRATTERGALLAYLPPATPVLRVTGDLASPQLTTGREDAANQALTRRADFRAQSARLEQLRLEEQVADRLRIPEPTVLGGLKRIRPAPNQGSVGAVIGVSIPLPVFNTGRTEVARLAAEQDRVRGQRDILAQQVTAAVTAAYDVFTSRSTALAAFDRETADSGAELLRTARVGYEEGELGILQLLDAYRLKTQTALRRLELQLAVKESEIELARAAGFEVTQ